MSPVVVLSSSIFPSPQRIFVILALFGKTISKDHIHTTHSTFAFAPSAGELGKAICKDCLVPKRFAAPVLLGCEWGLSNFFFLIPFEATQTKLPAVILIRENCSKRRRRKKHMPRSAKSKTPRPAVFTPEPYMYTEEDGVLLPHSHVSFLPCWK